jgi:hypothetical protein
MPFMCVIACLGLCARTPALTASCVARGGEGGFKSVWLAPQRAAHPRIHHCAGPPATRRVARQALSASVALASSARKPAGMPARTTRVQSRAGAAFGGPPPSKLCAWCSRGGRGASRDGA